MTLPKPTQRFEAIEDRLDKIEKAIAGTSSGWGIGRAYRWISNHKATSLLLSIILCALSIFAPRWLDHRNQISDLALDARINHFLGATGGVNDTLRDLRDSTKRTETSLDTLKPFIQEVITHEFESVSRLPAQSVVERLTTIKHLIAVARDEKATVATQLVLATSRKLLTATNKSPAAWPVVGELASYRSEMDSGWTEQKLPECGYPLSFKADTVAGSTRMTHGPITVKFCKLILDSTNGTKLLSQALSFADLEFDHCLIIYNGGPIVITPVKIAPESPAAILGTYIQFSKCRFLFSLPSVPAFPGQRLTRDVLMAETDEVKFEASRTGM